MLWLEIILPHLLEQVAKKKFKILHKFYVVHKSTWLQKS